MPNDEAREAFPKILAYYMNRDSISQTDISVRLNVSKQIVSDWVSGKKFPRVDKMQRLADLFGVLLSDMYTYDKLPTSHDDSKISEINQLTSDEQHLVTTYRGLTPYGKQLMMDRAAELTVLYGEKQDASGSSKIG